MATFVQFQFILSTLCVLVVVSSQQLQGKWSSIKMLEDLKSKLSLLESKIESQELIIADLKNRLTNQETKLIKVNRRLKQVTLNSNKLQTHYRTCHEFNSAYKEIVKHEGNSSQPVMESGHYWIDIDGQGFGEPPLYVYCNMTDGTTSIGRQDECSAAGEDPCFITPSTKQLELLMEMSDQCISTQQENKAIIDCKGRRSLFTIEIEKKPSNCTDLRLIGHRLSGFYLVKDEFQIKTVYCHFNYGDELYEKLIGFNDIKSTSAYFYVQRESLFTTQHSVIPFETERLNIGGAMNITSGVFTSPTNGRFFFSVSGMGSTNQAHSSIYFQVNSVNIGMAEAKEHLDTFSLQATLHLNQGDEVTLFLTQGDIFECCSNHYLHYTGMLIEEDLLLQ